MRQGWAIGEWQLAATPGNASLRLSVQCNAPGRCRYRRHPRGCACAWPAPGTALQPRATLLPPLPFPAPPCPAACTPPGAPARVQGSRFKAGGLRKGLGGNRSCSRFRAPPSSSCRDHRAHEHAAGGRGCRRGGTQWGGVRACLPAQYASQARPASSASICAAISGELKPKYSGPAMAVLGGGGSACPAARRAAISALMRCSTCGREGRCA